MQVRCFKFCSNCIQDFLDGITEFTIPVSISETTIEDCDHQENVVVEAHNSPKRLRELN